MKEIRVVMNIRFSMCENKTFASF